jgi:hypothetical protein
MEGNARWVVGVWGNPGYSKKRGGGLPWRMVALLVKKVKGGSGWSMAKLHDENCYNPCKSLRRLSRRLETDEMCAEGCEGGLPAWFLKAAAAEWPEYFGGEDEEPLPGNVRGGVYLLRRVLGAEGFESTGLFFSLSRGRKVESRVVLGVEDCASHLDKVVRKSATWREDLGRKIQRQYLCEKSGSPSEVLERVLEGIDIDIKKAHVEAGYEAAAKVLANRLDALEESLSERLDKYDKWQDEASGWMTGTSEWMEDAARHRLASVRERAADSKKLQALSKRVESLSNHLEPSRARKEDFDNLKKRVDWMGAEAVQAGKEAESLEGELAALRGWTEKALERQHAESEDSHELSACGVLKAAAMVEGPKDEVAALKVIAKALAEGQGTQALRRDVDSLKKLEGSLRLDLGAAGKAVEGMRDWQAVVDKRLSALEAFRNYVVDLWAERASSGLFSRIVRVFFGLKRSKPPAEEEETAAPAGREAVDILLEERRKLAEEFRHGAHVSRVWNVGGVEDIFTPKEAELLRGLRKSEIKIRKGAIDRKLLEMDEYVPDVHPMDGGRCRELEVPGEVIEAAGEESNKEKRS